jgi:hypothetical protein
MTAAQTMRARFLAAAEEIAAVYRDASGPIWYDGRHRIRDAYKALLELAAWIPDTEPGWLPYGDMPAAGIAAARRNAEKGLASPEVTLQLIRQVQALREQLTAIGGAHGVTDSDIGSMIAEGFATAWRKAVDSPESVVIWKLIKDMDRKEWGSVIDFVADPLIAMLREAERRPAAEAEGRHHLTPGELERLLADPAVQARLRELSGQPAGLPAEAGEDVTL